MTSSKSLSLAAFLLLALSGPSAQAAVLTLGTSASSVAVGGSFDVRLGISGLSNAAGDSLSAFDMDLLYNPAVFQLTGYHFLDTATARNQLDLPESGVLPFDGAALAYAGVIDAYGVSGNSDLVLDADQASGFTFLTLTFQALGNQVLSDISLVLNDPNLLFLDSQYGDLSVSYANTAVMVNVTGATVSEPATLALSALGLGLMLMMRSRCS